MLVNKPSINALRARIAAAVRRTDEITLQLCPGPTRLPIAEDITKCVELMLSDAVDLLIAADNYLILVRMETPADGSVPNLSTSSIAALARAEQKVMHAIDQVNRAQQMVDGDRNIWGEEIRHNALWYK